MAKRGYADVLQKDPTKSAPAQEKIGRTNQKLTESDRRSLAEQIARREEEILAKKDMNSDADVSEMKRDIEHKKMILQHDDDLTPKSDSQRDRLAMRAKEIADVLKEKMPTHREMWPKSGSVEASRAVRHNLQFQEKYGELCREWQDIQNKLNPDDPNAQSLELIRPD
jgi:hypothetical protein